MLKVLRYAMATVCFAASVGCLALWGWSLTHRNRIVGASWHFDQQVLSASVDCGETVVSVAPRVPNPLFHPRLQFRAATVSDAVRNIALIKPRPGLFGMRRNSVYFPLWYPALVFALTGVAAVKLDTRFSLRSAMIATTVIAGLLGMLVTL
jgi:hypothetical protein